MDKKIFILEIFFPILLVLAGIFGAVGFWTQHRAIFLATEAWGISPLPIPFRTFGEYQNFSKKFYIQFESIDGNTIFKEVTSTEVLRISGPHRRKIVFMQWARMFPLLSNKLNTEVGRWYLCGNALEEMFPDIKKETIKAATLVIQDRVNYQEIFKKRAVCI